MDKLWYLSQIDLFSELPQSDLQIISKMVPESLVKRGTLISTPREDHRVLYLLKTGKVRLYKVNAEGRQFTLGILGAGNVFGEIETLSTGTRNVFVEAIDDTLLCSLRKSDLERMLRRRPELALKLLRILSERLQEMEDFLENLALGDIKTRLVFLLVKLAEHFGTTKGGMVEIQLRLTHEELAEMIGATRESVSHSLSDLRSNGMISVERHELHIDLKRAGGFLDRDEA